MKKLNPYEQLIAALLATGAQRLAEINGPNPPGHPSGSTLEFWNVPDPKPGRLVVVQRWTSNNIRGAWDAYVQINKSKTAEAIVEVIGKFLPDLQHEPIGTGECPVCGHAGSDCTGKAKA